MSHPNKALAHNYTQKQTNRCLAGICNERRCVMMVQLTLCWRPLVTHRDSVSVSSRAAVVLGCPWSDAPLFGLTEPYSELREWQKWTPLLMHRERAHTETGFFPCWCSRFDVMPKKTTQGHSERSTRPLRSPKSLIEGKCNVSQSSLN